MTDHLCSTFDPSCYRCELGRDELLPPSTPSAKQSSEMVWTTGGYGWFGVLGGALRQADIFDRFTEREREALARVMAERVAFTLDQRCDALCHTVEHGSVRCTQHLGHPGKHHAPLLDDRSAAPQPDDNAHTDGA